MRFILKCAFWLGLVAFLLPFGTHRSGTEAEISWLGAFAGVQEALQDLGGFCERAPRACETGREVGLFASERIADGVAIAYDFVDARWSSRATDLAETRDERAPGAATLPDPLTTSGVSTSGEAAVPGLPRAYIAPKRSAPPAERAPVHAIPVVPTPAPRA